MKIVISPAKIMKDDSDFYVAKQLPLFYKESQKLLDVLSTLNIEELGKVLSCNSKLASQAFDYYSMMNIERGNIPALFAFNGMAYKHMAPRVFTLEELSYVEEHLRILSGFYGILRCDDAISLYRLDMNDDLKIDGHSNLYSFWGRRIADELFKDEDCIVNLASDEYSKCFMPYKENIRVITCVFAKRVNGRLKSLPTDAKMLRGEMVRYMAENQIEDVELIKLFNNRGFCYSINDSSDDIWYFVNEG